ncbi:MAG: hypothetical protein R2857_08615 [Vampirovibrionales bacterium]
MSAPQSLYSFTPNATQNPYGGFATGFGSTRTNGGFSNTSFGTPGLPLGFAFPSPGIDPLFLFSPAAVSSNLNRILSYAAGINVNTNYGPVTDPLAPIGFLRGTPYFAQYGSPSGFLPDMMGLPGGNLFAGGQQGAQFQNPQPPSGFPGGFPTYDPYQGGGGGYGAPQGGYGAPQGGYGGYGAPTGYGAPQGGYGGYGAPQGGYGGYGAPTGYGGSPFGTGSGSGQIENHWIMM